MGGAMAADMAANRLRQVGGAIRDGAIDYRNFYFRELPEMVRGAFGRRPPPPPQDFAEAAGAEAAAAEEAEMANIGIGGLLGAGEAAAVEGAEAGGIFGPIPGLIGAGLGGAAAETATSLMFRNREAPQAQSSFLDARTLNNQSQTVRPIQPRFQRHEGFEERSSGSAQTPQYFDISSRSPSRDVMRPTAAPILQPSQRSAQSVIDETAEAPSRGERVRFTRNRAPPSQVIEGEPNPGMMADRAPKESYRDIMQATAAPTAPRNRKRGGAYSGSPYVFPMSSGPLPAARPSSSRDPAPNRRNKGPPKKKDDDKSSK